MLVEKGNVSELAVAMKRLSNDSIYRIKLGQMAKERVLEKFDQYIISGQLLSIIKRHVDVFLMV